MAPNVRKYMIVPPGTAVVMLPPALRSYGSIMCAHTTTCWPKGRRGGSGHGQAIPTAAATAPVRVIHDVSSLLRRDHSADSSLAVRTI